MAHSALKAEVADTMDITTIPESSERGEYQADNRLTLHFSNSATAKCGRTYIIHSGPSYHFVSRGSQSQKKASTYFQILATYHLPDCQWSVSC